MPKIDISLQDQQRMIRGAVRELDRQKVPVNIENVRRMLKGATFDIQGMDKRETERARQVTIGRLNQGDFESLINPPAVSFLVTGLHR